jgi:ligand-binding SRPBCC domain-containing protein
MPLIRIETIIKADRQRCFDLARSVGAHLGSTADSGERVVAGRKEGLLELGEEVTWEATHLGIRQRLTARITRLEPPVLFVDEMVKGAFAEFQHTHEFEEHEAGTLMRDLFAYRSPLGILGNLADALFLERYMTRFLEKRAAFLKSEAERSS